MITLKSKREIELMRIAGNIVYKTHKYLEPFLKPGITTQEIDDLADKYIRSLDATPSCKGYEGFPAAICISVNDEIVHGIASQRKLEEGDIVTLDICACYKGYHGDSAWSYAVGNIDEEKAHLMKYTEEALFAGLNEVKPGNRIGDIGYAVSALAKEHGLGVVKELCGHGIGTDLHEDPDVPNYGLKHTGVKLREGMVIAVEPMLTAKSPSIEILDDDWTIVTRDHHPAAHFEHTVVVTSDGYEILTGEWKDG